ncbi:MAG: ATP-dependent DNA helicase [Granulosicoccus sp.]
MSSTKKLRVSVTALANFACKAGDLMPMGVAGPTAREGMRAHKAIQKKALERVDEDRLQECSLTEGNSSSIAPLSEPVQTELTLSCTSSIESTDIVLRGRVDIADLTIPRLTEIKTTLVPAEHLPETQHALQWAQLKLYAFLYLNSDQPSAQLQDKVELELLHANIRADDTKSELEVMTRSDASEFAHQALLVYVKWMHRIAAIRSSFAQSSQELRFPHLRFRVGQRDMAAAVYRSARDGDALLCEAPTGIGKTISTLFPAAKALGEGEVRQVTYLTAKVAGRLSAMQALNDLSEAGLLVSAVQIRAKQATCFCSNGRCERDDTGRCPMTIGFFDRLPAARDELISMGVISDEQLDDIAWNYQLCPFELALQMLPWVHVVVADYNYVFDPLVRLPHYSESRLDSVLLIDEAHNLLDRSREMFSGQLSRIACLDEAHSCRFSHPTVASALERLSKALLAHASDLISSETVSDINDSSIARAASKSIEAILSTVGDSPPLPESSSEMFRALCRYVAINELYSEQHRTITHVSSVGKRKEVLVTLYCIDASNVLAKQYKLYKSQVVFSATLRPSLFYRDTLGLPESTPQLKISSPFDSERTLHAVVDWVDTRYRKRASSIGLLTELIKRVSDAKFGNYLVFFPSYAYLELVYSAFTTEYPSVAVWKQSGDQSKDEQKKLLDTLEQPGHRVGFAIVGGVFGEGIDYLGDKLIGVVVVSTGLPGLDAKTQLVSDHYREKGHDGYDFAYRYPGFTRVLQTAGRLIRSETDSGVVVLVDDRFRQAFYKQLYPESWRVRYPANLTSLAEEVDQFWDRLPNLRGQSSQ